MEAFVTAADLRRAIGEFVAVYEARPIRSNIGGMRFNHSFATWFMLKSLNPSVVIESGVWQGHSTWLIEQACPAAKLYCLDLNFSQLIYRSSSAAYIEKDFSECDWSAVERASAVCFFDDHQNAYARLKDLRWAGFTRAIFDDNFPCGEGDCYSLRHLLAGFGHERLQMSKEQLDDGQMQRRRAMESALRSLGPRQQMLVRANQADRILFERNCKEYFEFPPVALTATSGWGAPYRGAYESKPPIYGNVDLSPELRALMERDPTEFGYSYIAYVELACS